MPDETDARRGEGKAREEALWNEARERFPMHQDYTNDQNKACLEEQREWVAAQQSATPQPAQGEREEWREAYRRAFPPRDDAGESISMQHIFHQGWLSRANEIRALNAEVARMNLARQSSAAEVKELRARLARLTGFADGAMERELRNRAEQAAAEIERLRGEIDFTRDELKGIGLQRDEAEAQRDRARGGVERLARLLLRASDAWPTPNCYSEAARAALPAADEGVGDG